MNGGATTDGWVAAGARQIVGKREVVTITKDTADKLKAVVEQAVKDAGAKG